MAVGHTAKQQLECSNDKEQQLAQDNDLQTSAFCELLPNVGSKNIVEVRDGSSPV